MSSGGHFLPTLLAFGWRVDEKSEDVCREAFGGSYGHADLSPTYPTAFYIKGGSLFFSKVTVQAGIFFSWPDFCQLL